MTAPTFRNRVWDEDERSAKASWGHRCDRGSASPAVSLSRGEWMKRLCPESDPWVLLRRPEEWSEEQYRDHDFEPRQVAEKRTRHKV